LVPVRKQPGLKAGAFSPALLVPVAITGTNGPYKPRLMAFFPPMLTKHKPKPYVFYEQYFKAMDPRALEYHRVAKFSPKSVC
jgi:hypothetical protein